MTNLILNITIVFKSLIHTLKKKNPLFIDINIYTIVIQARKFPHFELLKRNK